MKPAAMCCEEDWAALHDRYAPYILAIARRFFGSSAEVEDAAQDTWLRIFGGLDSFEGKSDLKTWITRIAISQCLLRIRRSRQGKNGDHMLVNLESTESDGIVLESVLAGVPDRVLESAPARIDVETVLAVLTAADQQLLRMRYLEGMAEMEIAEHLGRTYHSVRASIRRAKQRIQRRFVQ